MENRLQPRCRIDEKRHSIDEVFLAEFSKRHLSSRLISCRRELHIEQAVCLGIDRSVQSESLVIKFDHGFVNHNMIRISTASRL